MHHDVYGDSLHSCFNVASCDEILGFQTLRNMK